MLVGCEFVTHQFKGICQIRPFLFFVDEVVYQLVIAKTAPVWSVERNLLPLAVNLLKNDGQLSSPPVENPL